MSSPLTVRRVSFDFSGVTFHWHSSVALSAIGNATSFGAVAFERMVCRAVREALPLVDDENLAQECRDFIAQEAMHSAAHKQHVKALVKAHPDLAEVQSKVENLCANLFGNRSLKARLGFAAALEGILPAIGRHMVERRDDLFSGADPRVSALLLWHFCEEIEHEATAVTLYRHLYPGSWRMWRVPLTLKFMARFTRLMEREFEAHAPARKRRERWSYDPEWKQLAHLARQTVISPWPTHTPEGKVSGWADIYLKKVAQTGDPVGSMA